MSQYEIDAKGSQIGVIGDNATVIYNQSSDYQDLIQKIKDKTRLLSLLPEAEQEERLTVSGELEQLKERLKQFKENVYKLYEFFNKIEIDSDRLRQAKAYFEQGNLREADAILKAEEMVRDLDQLIAKDEQLEREKAEIRASREQIASEFIIKARLRSTFYDQPNRLEQTCEFFEAALRAARTAENLFEYALFLQNHHKFDQAKPLYQEALQIYRDLAAENPSTFLPDVAMTCLNLSIFYLQGQPDRARSIALAKETLAIAEQFPQLPTVQKYAAIANQVLEANGE